MRTFLRIAFAICISCLVVPAAAAPPQFVLQWGSFGLEPGSFRWPIGITPAPDGSVLVADSHNHRIQRFGPNGEFLAAWGRLGIGAGEFTHPDDVAVDPEGSVYVVEAVDHRIQKFDSGGRFITGWTIDGFPGSIWGEHRIAAAEGVLFVTDTGYHRVLKYDGQGTLLASWGEEGGGPGQVVTPAGIATTPNRVFVADAGNRRIQWFDFDGALLGAFATRFENDGWPSGLALDDRGRVLVTDTTNHSVHVFTDTGVEVARWGGPGIVEGRFNNPYGIAVAPGGAVYVTEHDNHRVQLFRFEPLGVQPAAWSRVKTLFR